VWDVATGREIRRLPLQSGVADIVMSPDGRRLAVGAELARIVKNDGQVDDIVENGGIVRVFDLWAGNELRRYECTHQTGTLAFSPDGRRLAAVAWEGVAYLWDTASQSQPPRVLGGHNGDIADVAFSPDGRRVLTASYVRRRGSGGASEVKVWDSLTG